MGRRMGTLAESPPQLGTGSERRRWLVRDASLRLGAVAHAILALVFGGLGFYGLAGWSVGAGLLFVGLAVAHRRGGA